MTTDSEEPTGRARRWLVAAAVVVLLTAVAALAPGVGALDLGGTADALASAPDSAGDGAPAVDGDRDTGDAASALQDEDALAGRLPLADADTTILGEASNDSLGLSVASADVNGDGQQDLLVAAPRNDSAGENAGAVYLFYGPVEEGDLSASAADATFVGEAPGDQAGYAVDAGDVNGDGTSDLIVGAPLNDYAAASAGTAYVVYGGDHSGTVSLADADVKLTGETADDRAGWSVASAGNVTGDDSEAVLVGAPGDDAAGTDAGAAYLVADDLAGTVSLSEATSKLTGEAAGDFAGWMVSTAGDFDDDGRADVVVGARQHNSSGPSAGAAYVVTAPDLLREVSLSDARLKLAGVAARDNAGWWVSDAGDVNGDGVDDVVVGSQFNDETGSNAGAAYVVYGGADRSGTLSLADADVTVLGEAAGDHAGYSVSSAGSVDANCDEYADVIVGAPGDDEGGDDAGAAYLVTGGEDVAGAINLSEAAAKLVGEAAGDEAGRAVAGTGDVTGDGDPDVLVGAPVHDSDLNAGAAYVVAGDCPEPETTTTEEPETAQPTTETTTTPMTTTTPEEPTVEFINCTAFRVTGPVRDIEVHTSYFAEDGGFATDVKEFRPESETTVISANDIYSDGREFTVSSVTLFGESFETITSVRNPDGDECFDALPTPTTTTTTTTEDTTTPTTTPATTTPTTTESTTTTTTTTTDSGGSGSLPLTGAGSVSSTLSLVGVTAAAGLVVRRTEH